MSEKLGVIYTVILIIVLSVVSLVGCAEKEDLSTPLCGKITQTYSNSEYGFSMEYPADWDIMEDYRGYVVAFMGPYIPEYEYTVNINLEIVQLPAEMTLEYFQQVIELANESKTRNYNKISEYDTIIGAQLAKVFTITAEMDFDIESVALKDIGAIFIKDYFGYLITYDVPSKMHEDYRNCFELIIDSFKFE